MTDNTELKRLAEAATQGDWHHFKHGVIKGGPIVQFVNGSSQQQIAMTTGTDWMRPDEQSANAYFIAAANPAAVLALIAENERLEERNVYWIDQANTISRDQLKAENERLQESHEQICKNYNQVSYASEERGNLIDQLRAEVAGLKTGYEAYERVNAELKAENEALRRERDARHPFKPFHEPAIGFTGCVICGVYTDHGGLPCPKTRATADAALGQGEQP